MSREVWMELLRPSQVIAEREKCPLVFLPLGPLEWHGPHLPLGTDALNAQEASLRLAREVGGVVHPTLFVGTERERRPEMLKSIGFKGNEYIVGMDFPANSMKSLYMSEELLCLIVRAHLDLLIKQKYRLIVIMGGHGAENQIAALNRLAVEYSNTSPARVLYLMPSPGFTEGKGSASHASRGETSLMQCVAPDSVDLKELPASGSLRNVDFAIVDDPTFRGNPTKDFTVRSEEDPRSATADEGEKLFQAVVAELSPVIKKALGEI